MTVILLANLARGANCPEGVSLSRWTASLGAAEDAWRSFDRERFDDTLDAAALDLPCLSEAVSPEAAARYHLLSGFRMYVGDRRADAMREFAAARAAAPSLAVDLGLIPEGHEIRSLIPPTADGVLLPLPIPAEGITLVADGSAASGWAIERPEILQVIGPDGAVQQTVYLLPGDPLPSYPLAPEAPERPAISAPAPLAPAPSPAPAPAPIRRRPQWGALGVSGVAVGASIALYALAARSEEKFNDRLPPEFGRDELVGLKRQTNTLVWGSVAAGSVAAGGMVVFAVRR